MDRPGPHIANTRVETMAQGALAARAMSAATIAERYPEDARTAIEDALELEIEDQLRATSRRPDS